MNTNKKVLLIALLIGLMEFAFAQAPAIDWQKEYWAPIRPDSGTSQTQNHSGEDWFYYHKSSWDASKNQNGYICAGYSSFVNYYHPETADGCENRPLSWHCGQFESATNEKGNILSVMSLIDLSGNTVWFKLCLEGWFYKVIQTSDGGYVGVGPTTATQDLSGNPLYYNPNQTSGHVTDAFTVSGNSCLHGDNKRKIQLVKLDRNGNLVWQYIYGMVPYSGDGSAAYISVAQGFCLTETPEGYILMGGFAEDPSHSYMQRECLIETDANGYYRWSSFYGPTTGSTGINTITAIARTTSGPDTKYAIAGEEDPSTGNTQGFVFMIDNAAPAGIVWSTNYYGVTAGKNTRVSDVDFNTAGEIILPAGISCSGCYGGASGIANGKVYRINASNGSEIGTAADLGTLEAFDFKIGITHTQDGGYAVVSATQPTLYTSPTTSTDGTACPYDLTYWRTDAYVAKGNASNVIEWSETFDAPTVTQSGSYSSWAFPDPQMRDLKREECVYSISQDADGGFTIAGNTSSNFDDDYLAKLHSVCTDATGLTNAGVTSVQSYTVTGTISTAANYIITATGDVTFEAGNSVDLTDGFWAKSGSAFQAYIDPAIDCTPDYDSRKENISPDNSYSGSTAIANSTTDKSPQNTVAADNGNGLKLTVFPNPNTGIFNLTLESKQLSEMAKGMTVISVYNTLGKEIYHKENADVSSGISTIDISAFSAGVYLVKVVVNSTVMVQPIILQQ